MVLQHIHGRHADTGKETRELAGAVTIPLMRKNLPAEMQKLLARCERLVDRAQRLDNLFTDINETVVDVITPPESPQTNHTSTSTAQAKLYVAYSRDL